MPRVPTNPLSSPLPSSSMASIIKAYSLPAILFAAAMFYQLFLIPNAFPPSHYDGYYSLSVSFFFCQMIFLFFF
jgi:hypothetical protein